jgi:photosystem I reaction center subunit XII
MNNAARKKGPTDPWTQADSKNFHLISFYLFIMLSDSQVFVALFTALCTGILALRLGISLYE